MLSQDWWQDTRLGMEEIVHLIIHLYTQRLAYPGEVVEEIGILPVEIDRYDIPLVLHRLLDERFLPFQVLYLATNLARA